MAEYQLSKDLPQAKEYKEEVEFANEEWQIVSKVTKTENPDINKVNVDIYHIDAASDDKNKKLTLTGFIGRY